VPRHHLHVPQNLRGTIQIAVFHPINFQQKDFTPISSMEMRGMMLENLDIGILTLKWIALLPIQHLSVVP
jgi:hypothetical protein